MPFIPPLVAATAAGLAAVGVPAAAAAAAAPYVVGAVFTGVLVGAQILLTPRPTLPTPSDGSVARKQPLPDAIYGYGRYRTGGAIVFQEERDGQLWVVQAIHQGKIQGFVAAYLGDDEVEVDGDGFVVRPADEEIRDGRYTDKHVWLLTRVGNDPETEYSELRDVFGSELPTNFRGDGVASSCMRLWSPDADKYGEIFPGGMPQLSWLVDGPKLWDFRDEAQDPDDPDTWSGAGYDNSFLQLADYICFHPHGPQLGKSAVLNYLADWIRAADAADDDFAVAAGGTQKCFRSGFSWPSSMDPAEVKRTILGACDGMMWEMPDGVVPWAGKYVAPVITLTDEDILGVTLDSGMADQDVTNELLVKFTSPAHSYGEADTRSWIDSDDIARRGARRTETADLWQIQDWRRARRVARRLFNAGRARYRGALVCNLAGERAKGYRWVAVSSARLPMLTVIEISDTVTVDHSTLRVTIPFRSSGPGIEDWETSMEGPAPPDPTVEASGKPPTPVIDSAVAQMASVAGEQTGVYLAVQVEEPEGGRRDLTYALRYRPKGSPLSRRRIENFNDAEASSGLVPLTTEFVEADSRYLVEAATRGPRGTLSAWSDPVEVSTAVDETAPSSPTALALTPDGADVVVTWTNPASANLKGAQVWRSASATFGSASPIGTLQLGEPGSAGEYVDEAPAPDTYFYWVVAKNFSGVHSLETGPETITV